MTLWRFILTWVFGVLSGAALQAGVPTWLAWAMISAATLLGLYTGWTSHEWKRIPK